MEKQQLLDTLSSLITRYQSHRQYIDRAKGQLGKFSAAVIEKVVLDHEIKSTAVAEEISPLLPQLSQYIDVLNAERESINTSKGSIDEEVQELELRMLIGEMESEDFDKEVSDLRERQGGAAERITEIDTELAVLTGFKNQWVALATEAGHYTPESVKAPEPVVVAPEPVKAPEPIVIAPEPAEAPEPIVVAPEPVVVAPEPVKAPEAVVVAPEPVKALEIPVDETGTHFSLSKIQEDVGPMRSEPAPAVVRVGEEDVAIETGGVADDGSGDMQFTLAEPAGGSELFDGGNGEVEIDFGEASNSPSVEPPKAQLSEEKPGQRRALLLYQEGTAEEQIYPFTGDTLTIGRGRENDIQIKNDSKVSRYHCRIARRVNNFYIEDVKSSNGTLVNGELITERRLFGGEEVIIGETFFRFRIME